jgi:EmrB/QacA subfamily drug resistance transporter
MGIAVHVGFGMRGRKFDPRWLVLAVVTIGSFMTLLDSSIVNVALPGIIGGFHSSVAVGELVVTIYLVGLAVVIPVSGYLGERFGMKRLYMTVLVAFCLSSGLCALAWSMPSLVVFRGLQGLGGGMLQPVGMAIMFTVITPLERSRFMVLLGLPILLAPILGPTVGGYLTQFVSWRAIFVINLPIGVVDLILAYALLRETDVKRTSRLDAAGFLLSAIAFPSILFSLSEAAQVGWGSPVVLLLLLGGVAALAAFVVVELRQAEPMLQLRLLANNMFAVAMAITFVTQFCFFGSSYLLPLFLENVRGLGAAATGLVLFPSAILDFIGITLSGRLYNRVGPRPFALAGIVMYIVTGIALSRLTATTSAVTIAAIASLRGLGIGLCAMPVMTMAFNTVSRELMSRATALQNVLQRVFASASTAILTTIVVASLSLHGAPAGTAVTAATAPVWLLVRAFSDAFLAMALVGAVGIILALRLRDDVLAAPAQDLRPNVVEVDG